MTSFFFFFFRSSRAFLSGHSGQESVSLGRIACFNLRSVSLAIPPPLLLTVLVAGVSLSAAGWSSLFHAFPRGKIGLPFRNPSLLCELPLRLRKGGDIMEYLRYAIPLDHLLEQDTLPTPPRM